MVRLIAPNGATVDVSAEKAERLLLDSGWSEPDTKAPAKSRASKKPAQEPAEKQ